MLPSPGRGRCFPGPGPGHAEIPSPVDPYMSSRANSNDTETALTYTYIFISEIQSLLHTKLHRNCCAKKQNFFPSQFYTVNISFFGTLSLTNATSLLMWVLVSLTACSDSRQHQYSCVCLFLSLKVPKVRLFSCSVFHKFSSQ